MGGSIFPVNLTGTVSSTVKPNASSNALFFVLITYVLRTAFPLVFHDWGRKFLIPTREFLLLLLWISAERDNLSYGVCHITRFTPHRFAVSNTACLAETAQPTSTQQMSYIQRIFVGSKTKAARSGGHMTFLSHKCSYHLVSS